MLTFALHHVAAMSFVPFGTWWRGGGGEGVQQLSLKIGRDAAKKLGEKCST